MIIIEAAYALSRLPALSPAPMSDSEAALAVANAREQMERAQAVMELARAEIGVLQGDNTKLYTALLPFIAFATAMKLNPGVTFEIVDGALVIGGVELKAEHFEAARTLQFIPGDPKGEAPLGEA